MCRVASVEGKETSRTSVLVRKLASEVGSLVENHSEGMLPSSSIDLFLLTRDARSYLPSGSPVPGIMYPSCTFFLPSEFAAMIFAPNAAAKRADSRPIYDSVETVA